jgi:hypothetical protein
MSSDVSPIRGAFYAGAYGPTILLKVTQVGVARLHDVFKSLAAGSHPPLRLDLQPGVNITGLDALTLLKVDDGEAFGLKRTDGSFVWSSTADGWVALGYLLEPFLEGRTGHQYLTGNRYLKSEEDDDAIVEVSYGEPDVRL